MVVVVGVVVMVWCGGTLLKNSKSVGLGILLADFRSKTGLPLHWHYWQSPTSTVPNYCLF